MFVGINIQIMKKNYFIFLLVLLFVSCSSGSNDEDPKEEPIQITGVWQSGNYFLSFDKGFYSAYIDKEFIDSGEYTQDKNVVTCQNSYFKRKTTYKITKVSNTEIKADISFVDNKGNNQTKSITFTKSEEQPAPKNGLAGLTCTFRSSYFGDVIMSFSTFNSGIELAAKGSAAKYPLRFFYVHIGDKLFYQTLEEKTIQVPSIGFWNTDYNEVFCWKLTFSSNGGIAYFESVPL